MRSTKLWMSLLVTSLFLLLPSCLAVLIYRFTNSEFVLGLISVAAAVITASIQYREAKSKEVDARLFGEKQKVYSELIGTIMTLFHERRTNPTAQEQAVLVKKLQQIRTELIIWGSA